MSRVTRLLSVNVCVCEGWRGWRWVCCGDRITHHMVIGVEEKRDIAGVFKSLCFALCWTVKEDADMQGSTPRKMTPISAAASAARSTRADRICSCHPALLSRFCSAGARLRVCLQQAFQSHQSPLVHVSLFTRGRVIRRNRL